MIRNARVALGILSHHVGRLPHPTVKNRYPSVEKAGLKKGDIILEVDGTRGCMSDGEFVAWLLQEEGRGSQVSIKFARGGKHGLAMLPIP